MLTESWRSRHFASWFLTSTMGAELCVMCCAGPVEYQPRSAKPYDPHGTGQAAAYPQHQGTPGYYGQPVPPQHAYYHTAGPPGSYAPSSAPLVQYGSAGPQYPVQAQAPMPVYANPGYAQPAPQASGYAHEGHAPPPSFLPAGRA